MAISTMRKIFIAGPGTDYAGFLAELQNEALLHPIDISEYAPGGDAAMIPPPDHGLLARLIDVKAFLETFRPKESFIRKMIRPGRFMSKNDFYDIVRSFNPDDILETAGRLRESISQMEKERETLLGENDALWPWRDLDINPQDMDGAAARCFLGTVEADHLAIIDACDGADYEVLDRDGKNALILLAVHGGTDADTIRSAAGFRQADLPAVHAPFAARYRENKIRIDRIDLELGSLAVTARALLDDFDRLMVLLEYYDNRERRSAAFESWITTKHSFIIGGWIREEDLKRLESLISRFDSVTWEEAVIAEGETPPVALKNPGIFAPFQLITRLYNYPSYGTLDPSPLVSVFFALFFAIALTDAGYGLFLSLIAVAAIARLKGDKNIFWIMLWGGIFTIATGLLTGGIFGDLFRSRDPFIDVPLLAAVRDRLIWFDPMKEPMVFFRLVLLLGVVHVLTGLAAGFIANIRRRNYTDAIVDNAVWIVISLALLAMLFSTDLCVSMSLVSTPHPPLAPGFFTPAAAALAVAGLTVVIFGMRGEKSVFFRFFLGFLKLFVLSGIFSYLGDVLSYIRLMALGMVTAGIGMAVNAIAFMMYDIPVAGLFLTIVILVVGHLFNCAINMLGGFVHTLRLQYVEFFPKFFVGGGRRFSPLANGGRYVKIID